MSEFKYIPIPNFPLWIVSAPKRSHRPHITSGRSCVFCPGRENEEPDVYRIPEDSKEENYSDENYLYITTASGDQNLEDEWSNNNPQVISTFELINYIDDEDCSIIYERLLLFIKEKNLNIEV